MDIVRNENPSDAEEREEHQKKLAKYSDWLEGNMDTDEFRSNVLGRADARVAETWPTIRKHMSYLCKSRLCKEHNVDTRYCKQVTDRANIEQSNKGNRFFKVIRHNSEKDGCVDPNPPKLKNPCGDTCNEDATKGCLFSSS